MKKEINLSQDDKNSIYDLYIDSDEDMNPEYSYNHSIVDLVKSENYQEHTFKYHEIAKIVDDLESMYFCWQISETNTELLENLKTQLENIFTQESHFSASLNLQEKTINQYKKIMSSDENPQDLLNFLEKKDLTLSETRKCFNNQALLSKIFVSLMDSDTYKDLFDNINRISKEYERTYMPKLNEYISYTSTDSDYLANKKITNISYTENTGYDSMSIKFTDGSQIEFYGDDIGISDPEGEKLNITEVKGDIYKLIGEPLIKVNMTTFDQKKHITEFTFQTENHQFTIKFEGEGDYSRNVCIHGYDAQTKKDYYGFQQKLDDSKNNKTELNIF